MGGLALGTAGAVTPETPQDNPQDNTSPYQEIVTRNVFALKPPPPPPSPEDTKPPPSKITLTGITTFLGKKALMKTPPPPVKPGVPAAGGPPTDRFYMLGEHERDGDIEVVAIDEKAGSVKVINGGVEVTLTFEKDGQKLPNTPVAAAPIIPGTLPAPGGVFPPPAIPGTVNPAATGIKPTFPVRPMRGSADASGGLNPGYQSASVHSGVPLPSFTSAAPLQTQQTPQNTMPLEDQIINIEAQRQLTQNQVMAGRLPPLPPTIMTPPGSPGSLSPAPAENPPANTPSRTPLPGRPGFPGLPPLPGQ